jgi:phosphopantothenoylcysteine decarboxylase / phosphopantothenate---cysteine ligase
MIILIITGSIAAYKTLELLRALQDKGYDVQPVLTKGATAFVTPLSVAALSHLPPRYDIFDENTEQQFSHIDLVKKATAIVIAPASADVIAKASLGLADDLATTLLLVGHAHPVLWVPAMNPLMWQAPTTKEHIHRLQAKGWGVLEPEAGLMACGDTGVGRLPSLDTILEAIDRLHHQPLKGKKALVTSGGTREMLDPVRFIGNYSSGKQGHALAKALTEAGAEVTYIHGMVNVPPPPHVRVIEAMTAQAMLDAVMNSLPVDIAVLAAAVADWQLSVPLSNKHKKGTTSSWDISLTPTPDILHTLCQHPQKPPLVIGFAAETGEDWRHHGTAKYHQKGCDWMLVNPITKENPAFGSDTNRMTFIQHAHTEDWPEMEKTAIAKHLVSKIVGMLS